MKRLFLVASLCVISGLLFANGPKIDLKKLVHDFGDVEQGKAVTTQFEFTNVGDEDLEILDVATSCGCTTAKPEKNIYKPGESGSIPVTFNSKRFSGAITKRVTITTNTPSKPKVEVTIKAEVLVDVNLKPESIFMAKAMPGMVTESKIEASTTKLAKLEISDVKIEPEFLSAEAVRVDDKNVNIVVKADGSKFPAGKNRLNGYMTFKTNSKNQETVRASITINVEHPIRVTPRNVYFYASKAGKSRKMMVNMRSTQGQDFKVLTMSSDLDFLELSNGKDDALVKLINVVLSDKAPQGKFQGTITLKTDMKGQEEIQVPVRGSVVP